jgi:DHA1 family bicyclomycin/chloramphenicol resistance-like MFS transporter
VTAAARVPRRRLLVILGALSAFGPLTTDVYLPGLPDIARSFETPVSGVQLTLTACMIGLAAGQLLAGPVSDALGRRRPLLWGLAVFVGASLLCAVAPAVWVLDVARLGQGLAGAAGIVIARAMIRDLYAGVEAARFFSTLGGIVSIGPIVAPSLGALVLVAVPWPGIFVFLALFGAALWASVFLGTHETLPPERRRPGGVVPALRTYGELLTRRRFMAYTIPAALAFASLFAYISASSFVYQRVFGFSAQAYGVLFGVNGLAIMGSNLANARLVRRVAMQELLARGLAANAVAGVAIAAATIAGAGAAVILPLLFGLASTIGFVVSNSIPLALEDEQERAGSAAAVFGLLQFSAGALVAPVVGVAGASAVPMGIVMASAGLGAIGARRLLSPPVPAAV